MKKKRQRADEAQFDDRSFLIFKIFKPAAKRLDIFLCVEVYLLTLDEFPFSDIHLFCAYSLLVDCGDQGKAGFHFVVVRWFGSAGVPHTATVADLGKRVSISQSQVMNPVLRNRVLSCMQGNKRRIIGVWRKFIHRPVGNTNTQRIDSGFKFSGRQSNQILQRTFRSPGRPDNLNTLIDTNGSRVLNHMNVRWFPFQEGGAAKYGCGVERIMITRKQVYRNRNGL